MEIMKKATGALALGLALSLAACTATEPIATPTVPPAAATSTPTPTPDQPTTSVRGNLVKVVGEPFGYGQTADDMVATFVVIEVIVDPECTTEHRRPPENGHFVRIHIEGETRADLPGNMFFGLGAWKVIAENGTTFNGDPQTSAAWSCIEAVERLPDSVGPGERVAGSIIFDVPTPSGVLVFNEPGGGAWEWAYGG